MPEKDPSVKLSWLQPTLTVGGVVVTVALAWGAIRSDLRDEQTTRKLTQEKQELIDTAQSRRLDELTALVQRQTESVNQLTARLDRMADLWAQQMRQDRVSTAAKP